MPRGGATNTAAAIRSRCLRSMDDGLVGDDGIIVSITRQCDSAKHAICTAGTQRYRRRCVVRSVANG